MSWLVLSFSWRSACLFKSLTFKRIRGFPATVDIFNLNIILATMINYIGVTADGTYIERTDLGKLRQIPEIEHILEVEQDYNARAFIYDKSVTLINGDGSLKTLLIGNFELLDIGTVVYDPTIRDHCVNLMITDKRLFKTFKVLVRAWAPKLIQEQIMPLMVKLNDLGSYAAYELSLTNDALKKENEALRRRLEGLENTQ